MELALRRVKLDTHSTMGRLFVNGVFECVTLEDVVRIDNPLTPQDEGAKVMHQTAIPAGRYKVIINTSPRFKKRLMRLLDVPGFTGILIHSGNTAEDSSGCILVGQQVMGPNYIRGGSVGLPILQAKVQAALDAGEEVWIEITNDFLNSMVGQA